jgi:hypothetical protein
VGQEIGIIIRRNGLEETASLDRHPIIYALCLKRRARIGHYARSVEQNSAWALVPRKDRGEQIAGSTANVDALLPMRPRPC